MAFGSFTSQIEGTSHSREYIKKRPEKAWLIPILSTELSVTSVM